MADASRALGEAPAASSRSRRSAVRASPTPQVPTLLARLSLSTRCSAVTKRAPGKSGRTPRFSISTSTSSRWFSTARYTALRPCSSRACGSAPRSRSRRTSGSGPWVHANKRGVVRLYSGGPDKALGSAPASSSRRASRSRPATAPGSTWGCPAASRMSGERPRSSSASTDAPALSSASTMSSAIMSQARRSPSPSSQACTPWSSRCRTKAVTQAMRCRCSTCPLRPSPATASLPRLRRSVSAPLSASTSATPRATSE
mmetsp:Transcript_42009/g.131569  ORF Transcript_42009/g.131569 Transcript_42009/m.131569 type:complete len:258 (-) Transcript_42009:325-1098(-)